jgi:hypothetical protein
MPQAGYTLGRDVALDIIGPYGPVRLKIMAFEAKPKIANSEITPLNGLTDELLIPKGWTGTIDVERTDSTLDDFWAKWEDDFYNGVVQPPATITETIQETGGSVSVYRYENVVLHLADAGKKEGEKTVRMQLTFTARRRKKVG